MTKTKIYPECKSCTQKNMKACIKLMEMAKETEKERILKLINEIENPYPEDIFMPLKKEDLLKINLLLLKEMKFPIDRLSAHIGRIVFKNTKEELINQLEIK